jgi:hypothetical protein
MSFDLSGVDRRCRRRSGSVSPDSHPPQSRTTVRRIGRRASGDRGHAAVGVHRDVWPCPRSRPRRRRPATGRGPRRRALKRTRRRLRAADTPAGEVAVYEWFTLQMTLLNRRAKKRRPEDKTHVP